MKGKFYVVYDIHTGETVGTFDTPQDIADAFGKSINAVYKKLSKDNKPKKPYYVYKEMEEDEEDAE